MACSASLTATGACALGAVWPPCALRLLRDFLGMLSFCTPYRALLPRKSK
jgi:hypothetical protein